MSECPQLELGGVRIHDIEIDLDARNRVHSILRALQELHCDEDLREEVFRLLGSLICPDVSHDDGRLGMYLWQILVLGSIKQGLNCSYDTLRDLVNSHREVRQMLRVYNEYHDDVRFRSQTIIDNVSLIPPDLLRAVSRIVVRRGHEVMAGGSQVVLNGRADSFVAKTDVVFPTDVGNLRRALAKAVVLVSRSASEHGIAGWRQRNKHLDNLRRRYPIFTDRNSTGQKWPQKLIIMKSGW